MPEQRFKSLFCQRFACPDSEFEEQAFKRCLYGHARLVAPLIRIIRPRYFARDFTFLGYLGAATDVREASDTASDFHDKSGHERGFVSRNLKLRVSGRKAIKLAHKLFSEASAQR